MTITTEDGNRQNLFDKMSYEKQTYAQRAEILNGRFAMLGFVIAVGTYLTTGQIVPGVF